MKQKRGISPLIATILLIGFTVVLAAVVLTWGQGWFAGLTEGTTESTNLQLACTNRGGLTISEVCDTGNDVRVTVMNTGNIAYTACTVTGGGEKSVCDGTAAGAVSVETLVGVTTLSAGSTVTSVFTIDTGDGLASCQGGSYIISTEGLKDC